MAYFNDDRQNSYRRHRPEPLNDGMAELERALDFPISADTIV